MEDLQLSLTPGRLDQRNFGVMLSNWRVGQVLNALVVNSYPDGRLLLSVGGKQLVTSSDIPIQPGTQLKLEVKQVGDELVLRQVADRVAAEQLTGGRSAGAVQTPHSSGMSPLLGQLSALGNLGSAELNALARGLLGRALKGERLSAEDLKRAVQQSGVFTEARLATGQTAAAASTPKGQLAALQQLALAMASNIETDGPEFSQLALLAERAGATLNGIVNQQLASVPVDDGPPRWVVSLPLSLAGQFHELRLIIERDDASANEHEAAPWRVTVHLDLPSLGGIDVTVMLAGERVKVDFNCEQPATSRWLNRAFGGLTERLERQQLTVERIDVSTSDSATSSASNLERPGSGIEVQA